MRTVSKQTQFIRKHYKKSNEEIIALGKAAGLTLDTKNISIVRYNWKKAKEAAAAAIGVDSKPGSKASKKPARAAKPDPELVKLVVKRGVDRVAAALEYVRANAQRVA